MTALVEVRDPSAGGLRHLAAIDDSSSLLQLAELFDDGETVHRWANAWAAEEAVVITDPITVIEHLDDAQSIVLARCAPALGFVDVSRPRRGLARAWSGAGGRELLSAGSAMHVEADPSAGLCVATRSEQPEVWTGVTEVTVDDEAVEVHAHEGSVSFDRRAARPLTDLVPGSTHWRVRPIPEVLVWAKTFHRLRDACTLAAASSLTVRLLLAMGPVVGLD